MLHIIICFRIISNNETEVNPREDFEKRRKELIRLKNEANEKIAEIKEKYNNRDINESDPEVGYSTVVITKVDPYRFPVNQEFQVFVETSVPFNGKECFCKFGKVAIRHGVIREDHTLSCDGPLLSDGEIMFSVSEDSKIWSVPIPVLVVSGNNDSSSFFYLIGFVVAGIVIYVGIQCQKGSKKRKKGRRHKHDDTDDQHRKKPKKAKISLEEEEPLL